MTDQEVADLAVAVQKQLHEIVAEMPALIKEARAGGGIAAALPLAARMHVLVEKAAGLSPALSTIDEVKVAVKAAILAELKDDGVDLPGPDGIEVGLAVDLAGLAWSHYNKPS